jgi:hypothetical protein
VSGRVTGYKPTDIALFSPASTDVQFISPRPDGTFEFPTVLPGNYNLEANTTIGFTSTPITVVRGKDLTNVEIKTPLAKEVPGRVIINNPAKPRVGFGILPRIARATLLYRERSSQPRRRPMADSHWCCPWAKTGSSSTRISFRRGSL